MDQALHDISLAMAGFKRQATDGIKSNSGAAFIAISCFSSD
jgi:hypothetical protein